MQLPIQAHPVPRRASAVSVIQGILPQACGPWMGRGPYCEGQCTQCPPGQICQFDRCGDNPGDCCASGSKVRCCDP